MRFDVVLWAAVVVVGLVPGCTGSAGDLFVPVTDPAAASGSDTGDGDGLGSMGGRGGLGGATAMGSASLGGAGNAPAGVGTNTGIGSAGASAGGSAGSLPGGGNSGSGRGPGGNPGTGVPGTDDGEDTAGGDDNPGGDSGDGSGAGASGGSPAGGGGPAGGDPGTGTDGADTVDPGPPCDSSGPFGEPELVLGLGVTSPSFGPAPSEDGLTLFFSSVGSDEDIFFATRATRDNQFSNAELAAGVNGFEAEGTPFLSADGRSLYFFSTRLDGDAPGGRDVWVANRSSGGVLTAPSVVPGINHEGLDHLPRLTADELTLMFVSGRDAPNLGSNIWVAQRSSTSAAFSEPVELAGVNTDAREEGFWLSADELTLYFASNRAGTQADMDIWVATRDSVTSAFGDAVSLGVVNTPDIEIDPAVTPDGFELFFASDRSGTMRLYRSARLCDGAP